MSKQSDFYNSVYNTAVELGATDTQAHLAAAQASQETGYGRHVVGNNYFGVKASPSYDGETVDAETSEGEDAVSNRQNQTFRAYDGLKASVKNYMDVMANAFPDSWNATNIADAAKGLVSGKFGRYAKDVNYPGKIQSIANKLGAAQKYAYAQEPENVPVPYGPEDDPIANSQQAQALDGLSGVVNPIDTGNVETSSIAPVGGVPVVDVPAGFEQPDPLAQPTNDWSTLASAKPIQAPMDSVTAQGMLSGNPAMAASATVPGGMLSSPQSVSQPQAISQADISRAFSNPTGQGMLDPSFTEGLMSPQNPVVPTAVETTSYTQQPEAVAQTPDLGNFPEAMAAQRMPATGIYSPEHLAIQAQAEQQLAESRLAGLPTFDQNLSVPATGVLGANPALAAQATVPDITQSGVLSAATPSIQTSAINPGMLNAAPSMTPSQIDGYQQAAKTMAQAGMLNIGQQPPTDLSGNLPTNLNVLSAPAPDLETVEVADQPTIAGPTTTSAITQQVESAVSPQSVAKSPVAAQQTQSQPKGILGNVLSKQALTGGILGGVLTGNPAGVLGGGLLGSMFSGLMNGGQPTGITNIGYGPAAVAQAYGSNVPGIQATATDGSTVNSTGGGWSTRTTANGVTTSQSPWGSYAGYFGSDDDEDADAA